MFAQGPASPARRTSLDSWTSRRAIASSLSGTLAVFVATWLSTLPRALRRSTAAGSSRSGTSRVSELSRRPLGSRVRRVSATRPLNSASIARTAASTSPASIPRCTVSRGGMLAASKSRIWRRTFESTTVSESWARVAFRV